MRAVRCGSPIRTAGLRGCKVVAFGYSTHEMGSKSGTSRLSLPRQVRSGPGGELGFARFDGIGFVPIHSGCDSSFTGISGIIATQSGDLWLNAIGGIVHLTHEELARVITDSTHPARCEIFDSLDGVAGFPIQTRPQPTALSTTDGRPWFALSSGIISIDPDHLVRNTLPPPVTIRSIASQGTVYANRGAILQLPVHTEDHQVNYTAGSLTIPERVHFRYKLDGSNKGWQDGASRRDAVYTNLSPGRYAFQVIASNNDGVWNETGATIHFVIPPGFTQTKWFLALCIAAGAALMWLLFMARLRQAREKIRGRLEARLAERERIARDLHDTLLQGVQGLMYTVHAGAERLPQSDPTRAMLEQALARADGLISDGRDRVMGLRRDTSGLELLEERLSGMISRLSPAVVAKLNMTSLGVPRLTTRVVAEEISRIVGEAVQNSATHAAAKQIDIEIRYSDDELYVRVRDDGRGFDRSQFEHGSPPRHFGLLGMSERAERAGGQLEILSRESAGTEVILRIPHERAYGARAVQGFWARLFRLRPRFE
jgi:signal transduction histidine kinase